MQTQSIKADYCSWTIVRVKSRGEQESESDLFVRGDIQGPLTWDKSSKTFTGWFELPARGEERGFYEITTGAEPDAQVLRRVAIQYTFDKLYFSPRWENINQLNAYLANHYASTVQREVLYRYPKYKRDIQLLKITDPSIPLAKKQIIFLTARVHNPESGTTASLYRFVKWLLEGEGREFLREYLFLVIPMVIPLTFEEDPRLHSVNREWRDEMIEPDLLAIREKVLDRYMPEAWIDCHTFNAEMDLTNIKEMRTRHSDYIVAHTPEEQAFDESYSRDIALRLIRAAEEQGHQHRNREYFLDWERNFKKSPFVKPGERVKTRFHPAGIFSGKDYAFYADRDAYGPEGRTWAAMACDYGYARCHAINLCLESKPLHVYWGTGPFHYPRRFSDSTVVKLQELCRLGREHFPGQHQPGFPCNLILSDVFQNKSSAILCAGGKDRESLRQSRGILWRQRRSIQIRRDNLSGKTKGVRVGIFCVGSIPPVPAVLRVPVPAGYGSARVTINSRAGHTFPARDGYIYVPLTIRQGKQNVEVMWVKGK